jgi:hypothetical protein
MLRTFIVGINTDASAARSRPDITPTSWQAGVDYALHCLTTIAPCITSKAVIDAISGSGKSVTITPSAQTRFASGRIEANAGTSPDDDSAATAAGKPTEKGNKGAGGGSNCTIEFTPEDFDAPAGSSSSLNVTDEALLHELVHAMRQVRGIEDSTTLVAPLP